MLAASPLEATRWWLFLGRPFATALVVAIAFVSGLAGSFRERPLETHEVYVAQTAREMMAAGDFVRPVFNAVLKGSKDESTIFQVLWRSYNPEITGEFARPRTIRLTRRRNFLRPTALRLPSSATA